MMDLTVVPAAVVFARAAEVVVSRRAVLKGDAVMDLQGLHGTSFRPSLLSQFVVRCAAVTVIKRFLKECPVKRR